MKHDRAQFEQYFRARKLRFMLLRLACLEFVCKPMQAAAKKTCEAANRRDPRASRAAIEDKSGGLIRTGLVRRRPPVPAGRILSSHTVEGSLAFLCTG